MIAFLLWNHCSPKWLSLMHKNTARVLNRTLGLVARSFPQYVAYARPYLPPGSEYLFDTLHDVAKDQTFMVERIAETISGAGYVPDLGEFPMDFTSKHDLGIDCLLDYAIERQRPDIDQLHVLSESLSTAAVSRTLVDETLGMAIAHLELLEAARSNMRKPIPVAT
jgi:bacterioferritin (cytochrome b1)